MDADLHLEPASIFSDLVNDGQPMTGRNLRNHKGEGATVTVPGPRVREVKA